MPQNRRFLLVKNVIAMGFAVAISYYKMEREKGQMQVSISLIMWIRVSKDQWLDFNITFAKKGCLADSMGFLEDYE